MSFPNPRRRTSVRRFDKDSEGGSALKATVVLRKGATFHCPTSPVSSISNDFVPPRLLRAHSHLEDVGDTNRRLTSLTLKDTEEDPAKTNKSGRRSSPRQWSTHQSKQASDSGLGSSIASSQEKKYEPVQTTREKKDVKANRVSSTLIAGASVSKQILPAMSYESRCCIYKRTLHPLKEKPSLKDFETILCDIPNRMHCKEIICLRDLEKSLIFRAGPERVKSATSYLDFCLSAIRCIQATVQYIPEHEQIRSDDRPYTNGYFIDLTEQIYEYGRQLAAAKDQSGAVDDNVNRDDKIRLHGGIADNGRPAELIRVKEDGTAVSMATGKIVNLEESPVKFKRSLSEQRDGDEEIRRSMARKRKNATAEELAPKLCRQPGCNKEFKRRCDLTKHEKTHTRPWKCHVTTCPYYITGWPTEKERGRHINDKHSDSPTVHICEECSFTSKRESNLKQHMERSHNTPYVRKRTNRKKGSGKSSSPAQQQQDQQEQEQEQEQEQTPPLGSVSLPTMAPCFSLPTPPQDQDGLAHTNYHGNGHGLAPCGNSLGTEPLTMERISPSSSASPYAQYHPYVDNDNFIVDDEELYAASMRFPSHQPAHGQIYHDKLGQLASSLYQTSVPYSAPLSKPAHLSPTGQEDVMLFTPKSLLDVDEGLGGFSHIEGRDPLLFDDGYNHKGGFGIHLPPLFGHDSSQANDSFSQASLSDFAQLPEWYATS
ncbi:hypothetical protein E4U42_007650 [Claviceps africana]|uniref:C2H2-type domain-containing protein n=1 Tax=Claviceps africana TaxID=83212 RepID=A0A8K0NNJ1_9HYPO|nr:hypothetical protein E4U42_007650 [Claviceps africana]